MTELSIGGGLVLRRESGGWRWGLWPAGEGNALATGLTPSEAADLAPDAAATILTTADSTD